MVHEWLTFKATAQLVFKTVVPFYIPIGSVSEFQYIYILVNDT